LSKELEAPTNSFSAKNYEVYFRITVELEPITAWERKRYIFEENTVQDI
jgi:hypothetical protein